MLINLRNALMAGKRLPYDAEVEYLESTGTQYITTGIVPDGLNRFEFTAAIPGNNDCTIFMVDNGATGRNGVGISKYNNNTIFGYKDGYTQVGQSPASVKSYVIDGGKLYIDGDLVADRGTSDIQNNYEIVLFAFNRNGSVLQVSGSVKIYSFKIYNANGVLVRDFIPVRKGTVGYLYDRVSGKLFYNAGTGDFVASPEIHEVEYVGDCAGGYIDTGVTSTRNTSFDAEFSLGSTRHDATGDVNPNLINGISGAWNYNSYTVYFRNQTSQVDAGDLSVHGQSNIIVDSPSVSSVYNLSLIADGTSTSTWQCSVDGSQVSSGSFSISGINGTKKVYILKRVAGAVTDNDTYFKVRSLKIYNSNGIVRDYIPIRVGSGSTWEGAMMDALTRRVYRNAGTGAFTYGNDLKYPIPAE